MGNVMVDVNHVSIRFIQNQEKVDNLKEYFIKLVTRKPIVSGEEELERNPRARSAKLRICEKI